MSGTYFGLSQDNNVRFMIYAVRLEVALRTQQYWNCLSGYEPKAQSDWDLEDHSCGCMRKTMLECESSDCSNELKDKFNTIPSMRKEK